jgi:N6-L-threonylcarbamoyladenine synthase
MNALGIETSCDETSAAVVAGTRVRSNTVCSSLSLHQKYGGIIPEIAFRMQLETISSISDCALSDAGLSLKNIKLVSVTQGPGLLGSLLVGISFAKAASLARGIPLVGVNHLHSHIYACFLDRPLPRQPFVSLVVSGGHTTLFRVKDFGSIAVMGQTLDDAAGEAFDKVAKILGLGYPGGPVIEKAALKGDPLKIRFSCSNAGRPLDFSFSGIKTAVLYYAQKNLGKSLALDRKQTADICASFQKTVVETLVEKSIAACRLTRSRLLAVGGGVAANSLLRQEFERRCRAEGLALFFPEKKYCMDNAAMVAGLGHWLFTHGIKADGTLEAVPTERG